MSYKDEQESSIVRNWYWVILINCFFIGVMAQFFFMRYPAWFLDAYRGVSLTHEMNYAVWWSGIYLFIAGLIFSRVGQAAQQIGKSGIVWYVVAGVMIALCIDEVGSIHEGVAMMAGWLGLLPFAIVIGGILCWALLVLINNKQTRVVAILILFGFSAFIGVAALEALEHDLSFQNHFWRRVRQVVEEAVELTGAGFFIVAGLVAMKTEGLTDRRFVNATLVVNQIFKLPIVVFILFISHSVVTAIVVVPNYTIFPEGNPGVLFPLLLCFCQGIVCWQLSNRGKVSWFWRVLAVLFVITSALQMYNFVLLLNQATGASIKLFTGPASSWAITLLPFMMISIYAVRQYEYPILRVFLYLMLLGLVCLLVYPDLRFHQRIESLYFLFSGAVSYSSFLVLGYIYNRQKDEGY